MGQLLEGLQENLETLLKLHLVPDAIFSASIDSLQERRQSHSRWILFAVGHNKAFLMLGSPSA